MKKVVITSGYFNPIHPGHIECLKLCKELGDELWVIVNNDHQAKQKTWKAEVFQNENFRLEVVAAIRYVDEVFFAIDKDWSVCETIRLLDNEAKKRYGDNIKLIFGKWGDRFVGNIPEVQVCNELWIQIKDWLGAKIDNSKEYRVKKERE